MAMANAAFLLAIVLVTSAAEAGRIGSPEEYNAKGGQHHGDDNAYEVDVLRRFKPSKEKVTQLHFYFHDTLSGKAPSAMPVAKAAATNGSDTSFGLLMMADDLLTEGPEPTSQVVGRAQGLYGSAGQDELSLIMAMSYSFTGGEYNGSSLSVMGHSSASLPTRELPIVGGTGVFRMARGFAMTKTYSMDVDTGDAIVEYNVTAIHY